MKLPDEVERKIEEASWRVVSLYLQSWGQSISDRIEALNGAAAAAGLDSRFEQSSDGMVAGWRGTDTTIASEMKSRFDREVFSGRYEDEARNAAMIIKSAAEHKIRAEYLSRKGRT